MVQNLNYYLLKKFHNFELEMSKYQNKVYDHFDEIEKKLEKRNRQTGSNKSTYRF